MAKQAEQPKGKGRQKRKSGGTLLWGLLGLVILTAGVVSALYYMNRERIQTDVRLKVIKDFVANVDKTIGKGRSTLESTLPKGKSDAGVGTVPPAGSGAMPLAGAGGERTYTVKAGENLWQIAREGQLVDTPYQWRTILIQNRDKIAWVYINDEEQAWKVLLIQGQQLTVRPDGQPKVEPSGERKYAFQLASMNERQFKRGQFVVRTLMKDGYYAYLYRHEKDGQTWYRIRSGLYDSEARARDVGAEIRQRYVQQNFFPGELWVMPATAAEQRGEGMVFGAQLVRPWVVELRDRQTHAEGVRDLRQVAALGDFAYIWQMQNAMTKRFVYRVRIGFFASEGAAQKLLEGRTGGLWQEAKAVKVNKFEETLPGQPMLLADSPS